MQGFLRCQQEPIPTLSSPIHEGMPLRRNVATRLPFATTDCKCGVRPGLNVFHERSSCTKFHQRTTTLSDCHHQTRPVRQPCARARTLWSCFGSETLLSQSTLAGASRTCTIVIAALSSARHYRRPIAAAAATRYTGDTCGDIGPTPLLPSHYGHADARRITRFPSPAHNYRHHQVPPSPSARASSSSGRTAIGQVTIVAQFTHSTTHHYRAST